MSQPVKLSEGLVLDARTVGLVQQRSIAGQVEFWARLGRSVELLLDGKQMLAVSRASGATSLTQLLDAPGTPEGRETFENFLKNEPYPHYEVYPGHPDLLVRSDKVGSKMVRTVGRFVNREFVEEELESHGNRGRVRLPAHAQPTKAAFGTVKKRSKAKSSLPPQPAARTRAKNDPA